MADQEKNALVSVKDLAGVSPALTKLAETVGAVLGRALDGAGQIVHTYLLAEKEARNEAERIKLIEGAKTDEMVRRTAALAALGSGQAPQVQSLTVNPDGTVAAQLAGVRPEVQSLHQRAEQRQIYQNAMHQLNLESVVGAAAEELAAEGQVSEEAVKPDWSTRFFDIAQDVSEQEAQILLGKILAGEVKKPGSFSLRTLDVLRNLSQEEAAIFKKVCNYVCQTSTRTFIIKRIEGYSHELLEPIIPYQDVLQMIDCGLIQGTQQDKIDFFSKESGKVSVLIRVAQHIFRAFKPDYSPYSITTDVYSLTKAAIELFSLLSLETDFNYFEAIAKQFQKNGFRVQFAVFNKWENKELYATPLVDF